MSVLDGPRREQRRIAYNGTPYWAYATEQGLQLGDGRLVAETEVRHLPPCTPSKILCVHVNYRSRFYEFTGRTEPPPTPTYFQASSEESVGEFGLG